MASSLSAALRRPPWLRLAHAAWWVVAALALAVLAASIPGYLQQSTAEGRPVAASPQFVAAMKWLGVLASLASVLVSLSLAALLFARKSGDRMAVFLSFYLLVYGVTMGGPLERVQQMVGAEVNFAFSVQGLLLTVPTVALLCLFPSGGFAPPWSRWVLAASVLMLAGIIAMQGKDWYMFDSPASVGLGAAYFIITLLGMVAQIYRYRRLSTPTQRQQTRWMVAGLGLFLGMILLTMWPYTYLENLPAEAALPWWAPLNGAAWWLTLDILPLSLSVAILRNRLFDIDLIIRRTLQYSLLSGLLALVYFGGIVVLQSIFTATTGQSQSPLVTVLSTLAIAALFFPLRKRVQDFIDRRFFRQKYDAAKTLADFAATARDETDLDKLTARLVEVVDETMQPESVGLWLKPTADGWRQSVAKSLPSTINGSIKE